MPVATVRRHSIKVFKATAAAKSVANSLASGRSPQRISGGAGGGRASPTRLWPSVFAGRLSNCEWMRQAADSANITITSTSTRRIW